MLVVLCMDTSYSMRGEAIDRLNDALAGWARSMQAGEKMARTTEFALITFGAGGVRKWRGSESFDPRSDRTPFVPAHSFQPPKLIADGVTPLVEAVRLSISVIEARKRQLARDRVTWKRPLVWLVTDGRPTDDQGHPSSDWRPLAGEIRGLEANQKLALFAIGIPPIDDQGQATLRELAPERNMMYGRFDFSDILVQLDRSVEDPNYKLRGYQPRQA
ncbi:hypothetical protein BL254_19170 [Protofrankia sp. BMG5.30]|nr:hypothetical protein BL254_19170 [Protofrankia sp. BMG5.30]